QVYLWEKDLTKPCSKNSSTIPGHWSVVLCHSGIPLPSLLSRETQVTSCFLLQGSQGKQCHTTFSFVDNSCLIMTTLTLQWEGSGCLVPPAAVVSAFWNYISVSHQTFGMRENELLQRKGTLISQYAHGQCLISIAVNSLQQHSKLLYLHPMCSTVVVANVSDAVGQQDLYNANNSKSHWVSDLAWCRDNTYVVGCLRSGSVFIATRMGPLVKISCSGENLQLQAAMMLPVHPYSATPRIDSCNENLSESSDSSPSRLTFSVSCHPVRDQFLLSSGLRVSVLALPENGRRDAEVVDQLLATAHHALYLLRHSSLTHDYAYIRCSTWRLARSVLDLSQNINESLGADESKIHLWGKKNQNVEECKTYPDVATEGEHM
ncbi:Ciliogenesis and planar polarity effector 1-like 2, partial [Homarus americanus]